MKIYRDKKRCTRCQNEKYLYQFAKDKRNNDGFSSWCKECHNRYNLVNKARKTGVRYYKNKSN